MKKGQTFSATQQGVLILLSTLALLPHLSHLKPVVSLFFLSTVGLRLVAIVRPRWLPGRWVLFALTLCGLATVLSQYPILFGKDAGVALLTTMLSLKLMELTRRRDAVVLVFISYFALITQFLYRQEMLLVGYVLLVLVGLTAVLVQFSKARLDDALLPPLRVAFSLLLQALPLMIALFIFFPRVQSPLWQLGPAQGEAVTGISDRISPGNISQLSQSTAVAFRVEFEQEIPPAANRYWRGPVLWWTDGREWNAGPQPQDNTPRPLRRSSGAIDYSVALEPTPGQWLFALDLPVAGPANARLQADFQLLRNRQIKRRIRYPAQSVQHYHTGPIGDEARRRALQLPTNLTPRMRALVERWRSTSASDIGVVEQALTYFRQQPFYYTLSPPPMLNNPADQFLFDERRGFCGHYATSFTLMMRMAGIPARMVVGYQGGEVNPLGDYLIVRQSDAHAWSEVWLEQTGWTRIDPTAAVAPERIERSFDPNQVPDDVGAPIVFSAMDSTLARKMMRYLGLGLDALNSTWHRWVLGYSNRRQSQLMEWMGLGFLRYQGMAYAMVAAAGLSLLLVGAALRYRSRVPKDPIHAAYLRFCQRLGKTGLIRRPHEGPRDFLRRISTQRPASTAAAKTITELYVGIRYGHEDNSEARRRFLGLVRVFKTR